MISPKGDMKSLLHTLSVTFFFPYITLYLETSNFTLTDTFYYYSVFDRVLLDSALFVNIRSYEEATHHIAIQIALHIKERNI